MSGSITLTLYGGSPGEIGGNRILLEWPDHRWLLDFGTRFGQTGKYFEEFVKPRGATLGLRDYLRMGLLAPLDGLYRADLCAHDPQVFGRYKDHPMYRQVDHVDGVLLSHGHIDHLGCIGFLKEEIPVYTGLMTALIGKCLQDPQPTGVDREFNYSVPRECAEEGEILKTRKGPRMQRQYYVAETDPAIAAAMEKLKEFWEWVPGERSSISAKPLGVRDPAKQGLRFWRVDHSIPGSGAWGIETPIGWIIYSGDLRTHGHSAWRTEKFAKEAAALKPALLIVEGTRVGDGPSITEPVVHQATDEVVQKTDGLVIADFTARNIERLRTFRDIAKARGRRLVITTKDAYSLERMHIIDPNIPTPGEEGIAILKEPAGTTPSWEKDVCEKHSACFVKSKDIRQDPGSYILALSYWDISNLIDIEPNGGTYIYSSSEAYNEEQEIDAQRLCNWLDHFGLKRVGGLPGAEKGPYHASGHADGAALEKVIEEIGAKQIMPVHTEHLEWFEQRWKDRLVEVREGMGVSVG
jgi:ribonuclease J